MSWPRGAQTTLSLDCQKKLVTYELELDDHPLVPYLMQVTTVDRYQGQQNDYIILSLVRTRHVGHLRDVRRLVVAMSRARLGLYVLARVALFSSCTELQPTWKIVRKTLLIVTAD